MRFFVRGILAHILDINVRHFNVVYIISKP